MSATVFRPLAEAVDQFELLDECIALKSSTETEATIMFVDDYALLNHATARSGRDRSTFFARPIRPRSARLARNSANIKQAPVAARLYVAAPHVF